MRSSPMIEVDNSTPTILSSAKSVIPWHPWFGRTVAVYEVLAKQGQSVCRCGLEELKVHVNSVETSRAAFVAASSDLCAAAAH
jgi:hypothetical protein